MYLNTLYESINLLVIDMTKILQLSYSTSKVILLLVQYEP